jgi:hypothetical protein
VRPVIRMDQSTWCACHVEAFEYFSGVPARLVCDYVARHIIALMCPAVLCAQSPEFLIGAVPMGCDRAHNGQSDSSQLRRFWSDRQIGVLRCPSEVVGGSQARRAASFVLVLISA